MNPLRLSKRDLQVHGRAFAALCEASEQAPTRLSPRADA